MKISFDIGESDMVPRSELDTYAADMMASLNKLCPVYMDSVAVEPDEDDKDNAVRVTALFSVKGKQKYCFVVVNHSVLAANESRQELAQDMANQVALVVRMAA